MTKISTDIRPGTIAESLSREWGMDVRHMPVGISRPDLYIDCKFLPYHECPHCTSWSFTVMRCREPGMDDDILMWQCSHCKYRERDVEIDILYDDKRM